MGNGPERPTATIVSPEPTDIATGNVNSVEAISPIVQDAPSGEVHATGYQPGYTLPTETRAPDGSLAMAAIFACPEKCNGWRASEKLKLVPGDGTANPAGRSTATARPQSIPRTGDPAGLGARVGAGGTFVDSADPQPATVTIRPAAASHRASHI